MSTDTPEIQNEMIKLGVYALTVRGEGHDLLMGKNVAHYVKIEGLEDLLMKFIKDLDHAFRYIYKDNLDGFIGEIEKKFKIPMGEIRDNLRENIIRMKETNSDDIMIYYLIITKTLEALRRKINDKKLSSYFDLYPGLKKQIYKDSLHSLDCSENPPMSLLYNLLFVEYLAEIYEDKKMQEKLKETIKTTLSQLS